MSSSVTSVSSVHAQISQVPYSTKQYNLPTTSEYLFWASSIILLIISSYWLQYRLNYLYHTAFVFTWLTCVFCKRAWRALRTIPAIWLLCFTGFLGIGVMFGHGDRIFHSFYMMIRSIPFYILGYTLARYRTYGIRIVLGTVVVAYTMISVGDINSYAGKMSSLDARQMMAAEMIGANQGVSVDDVVGKLIYHFPTISLLALLALGLLDDGKAWVRVGAATCTLLLSVAVILSLWVAPTLLLFIGFCIMGILAIVRRRTKHQARRNLIGMAVLFIIGLVVAVNMMESSGSYAARTYAIRIKGIPSAVFGIGSNFGDLDDLSGTRISLAKYSLQAFLQNPIIGVGDYFEDSRTGGHSFWIDSLAKYGMIGAFPLYFCFGLLLLMSYRNWRRSRHGYLDLVLVGTIYSWALACFMNPYLLAGNMEFVVLLIAGVITGRYYSVYRRDKNYLVANSSTIIL